jgi:hypothetical protein
MQIKGAEMSDITRWQQTRANLSAFLKRVLIIEGIIVGGVLGLCLVAGWHSAREITLALAAAGAFVFAIGPFTLLGGWGNTRDFNYQYISTMDGSRPHERARQNLREMDRNLSLVAVTALLGSITILVSLAVQWIFIG